MTDEPNTLPGVDPSLAVAMAKAAGLDTAALEEQVRRKRNGGGDPEQLRARITELEAQLAKRVDTFYSAPGLSEGQLRRRKSADHEACHAATAIALGWTVFDVELTEAERGATYFGESVERTAAQLAWERLLFTLAPDVLLRDGSGSDRNECWDLGGAVACDRKGWSHDAACQLGGRDIDAVLNDAAREIRRLAATEYFRWIREEIRVQLDRRGRYGGRELIATFGAKKTPPEPKRKTTTRSNACKGCGSTYTPTHSSGQCASCRGGL